MNWNHDMARAPREQKLWLASVCGKVIPTTWDKKRGQWAGFATNGSAPVAWQRYVVPCHPNQTQERPSTNDEPSPEAGPQAEASPAGTGTGTLADREGRHDGEAVSADLPTDFILDDVGSGS